MCNSITIVKYLMARLIDWNSNNINLDGEIPYTELHVGSLDLRERTTQNWLDENDEIKSQLESQESQTSHSILDRSYIHL